MSPRPERRYEVIAAGLRAEILDGTYPPGTRLPGENQVMAAHGVARQTARQALAQLVTWGLAQARQGSGVYVRTYRPILRNAATRLSPGTWSAGMSVWAAETAGRDLVVDQVEVGVVVGDEVPPTVRNLLGLDDADAVRRSRRYVLDSKPVMLAVSWMPAAIAVGTRIMEVNTGPGGIYARLAEAGHAPVPPFHEELRAGMPGPDDIERLAMQPATPLVEIVRVAAEADGTPVEVNLMRADASAYVFLFPAG